MKRIRDRILNRDGSALLTVLLVVLISSIMVASFFAMSTQRSFMAKKLTNRTIAASIAEAGIHYAYSILVTNFEARTSDDAFPATAYDGGQFDVTVVPISNNIAVIKSEGLYAGVSELVILDVVKNGASTSGSSSNPPPQGAWACAIISGGDMTWTGSGMTDVGTGKIHTNGKDKHTGSCKITGNLSSCVRIWCTGTTKIHGDSAAPTYKGKSPGNVSGTVYTGSVSPIEIPDLDLTPYYNWALAHGEVYNGNKHISGSGVVKPNGGIMWVNGNLKMSGSGNMIGCFIATGYVKITGSGDQIKVNNFPAVVSRDGEIDISGSGKFHGLLYAKNGDFEKSGSGDVVGSIICAGTFKKSGSWNAMAYENSTPTPPGGGGGTPPTDGYTLVPTAWQR